MPLTETEKMKLSNQGHVAQWTRACGYEPQSRGFESLLAQKIETFFEKKRDKLKK